MIDRPLALHLVQPNAHVGAMAAASTASSSDQSSKSSFLTGLFRTNSRETPGTSSTEASDNERPPKKEGSIWSRRRMSNKRNDKDRRESKRELLASTFGSSKVKGAVAVSLGSGKLASMPDCP